LYFFGLQHSVWATGQGQHVLGMQASAYHSSFHSLWTMGKWSCAAHAHSVSSVNEDRFLSFALRGIKVASRCVHSSQSHYMLVMQAGS